MGVSKRATPPLPANSPSQRANSRPTVGDATDPSTSSEARAPIRI
jgi:hypothetical protein